MDPLTLASRIRLCILSLPAGLLLIIISALLYGERIDPTADPAGYAEWTSSASFALSNFLFVVGCLVAIFGMFALYAHLAGGRAERWALAALILTIVGLVAATMWIASDSVDSVVSGLRLEDQQAFLEQRYDSLIWLDIFLIVTNIFIFNIGLILFGVAIWRSETLPQGAAILWIASAVLFPAAALGAWIEAFTYVPVTIASCWIVWTVWRQPSSVIADTETPARVR